MNEILNNTILRQPLLNLQSLHHSYGNIECLKDINFEVSKGEVVALLGPSGSGKTTILRAIAGLEKLNSGSISINNNIISSKKIFQPPEKRKIGFVFQDYALFPHLTVKENVLFALSIIVKGDIDLNAFSYPLGILFP